MQEIQTLEKQDNKPEPVPSLSSDLVDIEAACRIIGGTETPIHPSTLWRLVKAGDLPKPIHLAAQIRRWRRSELEAFLRGKDLISRRRLFEEPEAGMNGIDHETTAAVDQAAEWFAQNREHCPRPIVPFLRERFGLSASEACLALTEARRRERENAK